MKHGHVLITIARGDADTFLFAQRFSDGRVPVGGLGSWGSCTQRRRPKTTPATGPYPQILHHTVKILRHAPRHNQGSLRSHLRDLARSVVRRDCGAGRDGPGAPRAMAPPCPSRPARFPIRVPWRIWYGTCTRVGLTHHGGKPGNRNPGPAAAPCPALLLPMLGQSPPAGVIPANRGRRRWAAARRRNMDQGARSGAPLLHRDMKGGRGPACMNGRAMTPDAAGRASPKPRPR